MWFTVYFLLSVFPIPQLALQIFMRGTYRLAGSLESHWWCLDKLQGSDCLHKAEPAEGKEGQLAIRMVRTWWRKKKRRERRRGRRWRRRRRGLETNLSCWTPNCFACYVGRRWTDWQTGLGRPASMICWWLWTRICQFSRFPMTFRSTRPRRNAWKCEEQVTGYPGVLKCPESRLYRNYLRLVSTDQLRKCQNIDLIRRLWCIVYIYICIFMFTLQCYSIPQIYCLYYSVPAYTYIYIIWYDSIHLQSPLPKHTQDFLSITYLDCLSRIHPIHLSSSHVSSSLTVCLCVCVSVCHVFVQSQRARQWKLASSEVKVPWGYYIVYPVLGVLVLCCCAGACCLGRNAAQKGGNTSSTSAARRNEEKEGSPWDTQGKDRLIDGLNSHFFCSSFNLRSNVFPNFFVERTNHSWRLLRNTHTGNLLFK